MAWYRVGTASFTSGGSGVTGSGTAWTTNARAGDGLRGPDGKVYEILSVGGDTSITLAENYGGSTVSGAAYAIIPTQGWVRDLTASVQALVSSFGAIASGPGAGKFADGSAGAPALSFASDTDTGFARAAANAIAMITGGVVRAVLRDNGRLVVGSSSDQAGRISGITDADGYAAYFRRNDATNNPGVGIEITEGTNTVDLKLAGSVTNPSLRFMDAGGAEMAQFSPLGNFLLLLRNTAPTLAVNRHLAFSMISNSQIRVSFRGDDGTTRTATIALT